MKILQYGSSEEGKARKNIMKLLKESPIPEDQLQSNLGLYLSSKSLARIIFMDHIFKQIADVPGVVMEFGSRWGQNLALFAQLRGMYDPFHRHRKIIGFDTFKGFPAIDPRDGKSEMMVKGGLALTKNYRAYLEKIMDYQEADNALSHIKKYELREGDANIEIEKYLKEYPETIIALAYFDFDIYKPTKKCLEMIKPRLVKGSIVGFDELNDHDSPGETLALMEVFGLNNIKLKRLPQTSRTSYFVVE